ncbi:hypothetical protein TpMuguga_04g00773 [Theileria parva strain Muguga]|uniref:Uncharacterized protein n=1 Tax=Theileria parva TaxID=5875 RepID=Q4N3K0_THEPA|nr:uncharacterized protein TpMuguga_04g00773 [Theileria parva strain Muguga]EAN32126.1 hypothetical protein TpMuguga_04g00773 [Theileria parva strain Muguga]|eukprot:XP_764409.1 hypothetical protein [Theileria parva strain Muguga]
MLFSRSQLFYLILIFKFDDLVIAPSPPGLSSKNNSDGASTRGSIFSVGTRSSSTSRISRSTGSSNLGGVVLDVDATDVSNKLEVSTSIPGILKYTLKSSSMGSFKSIRGNGKDLTFSKKIDHALCTSPFDGHLTVVFEDQTSEEYFLEDDGFKKVKGESKTETEAESEPVKPKTKVELIELDLEHPAADFKLEEVRNIKCYKPPAGKIISKIKLSNTLRLLENDVQENFVCFFQDGEKYSILVANRSSEKEWTKYTLSKQELKPILMDITLIRKFDEINPETIFVDLSTPEDGQVFKFDNLIVNEKEGGVLKSKSQGNKDFILEFKDPNDQTKQVEINFHKKFLAQEQLTLHSIKTNQDNTEFIFTYVKDNILFHEKYLKNEGKLEKDLSLSYGYNLDRTKKLLGKKNIAEQNVLFLKTLVPDSVDQGIKISHHGNFKVFDFDQYMSKPTFLIFPNLEFYLDKHINHKLIISETGSHTNMVMSTIIDDKKVHYVITTDKDNGNPFSIKTKVELLNSL